MMLSWYRHRCYAYGKMSVEDFGVDLWLRENLAFGDKDVHFLGYHFYDLCFYTEIWISCSGKHLRLYLKRSLNIALRWYLYEEQNYARNEEPVTKLQLSK